MNTQHILAPVLRSLSGVPPRARAYSQRGTNGLLGWLGLQRVESRVGTSSLLVAAGAIAGAAAALLFAPDSGRQLRTRLGKSTGGRVGEFVGKVTGKQLGAHPVATTRVINETREVFANK